VRRKVHWSEKFRIESSVKRYINILQVASKTASKHQKKHFLCWAGKLQICLRFDKFEANLCPKKVRISPKKTCLKKVQWHWSLIGQQKQFLCQQKTVYCVLIGSSRRILLHIASKTKTDQQVVFGVAWLSFSFAYGLPPERKRSSFHHNRQKQGLAILARKLRDLQI